MKRTFSEARLTKQDLSRLGMPAGKALRPYSYHGNSITCYDSFWRSYFCRRDIHHRPKAGRYEPSIFYLLVDLTPPSMELIFRPSHPLWRALPDNYLSDPHFVAVLATPH